MININEAYFLGLMYSKGDILELDDNKISFKINIKFRRPNDESIRSDNIYQPVIAHEGGKEKLTSRFINDFLQIKSMLSSEFGINFNILVDATNNIDWDKKVMSITSDPISNTDTKFTALFCVSKIKPSVLKTFPYSLKLEDSKPVSLSFIQGVCDGCSLVPNEATGQNGGTGDPRIQLEPNQDRWELCIGLCMLFQKGLGIRVNNINWGHPEIRNIWRGQNHQFRVSFSDIPDDIELYRLEYKREEYHNLYSRMGVSYSPNTDMCPLKKKGIHKGMCIYLHSSTEAALNDNLLHNNLKGISVDIEGKKSIIVCYLFKIKKACKGTK